MALIHTAVLSLFLLLLASSPVGAYRSTVTFAGLNTNVRTCTSTSGTFTIGEDVSTQFQSDGVIFSVNAFAIAWADASWGGALAINTIDNATNRCPVGRTGNNGVLAASFVHPVTGAPSTVSDLSVAVQDAESSVRVRTYDTGGATLHECANVFSGCPYVTGTAAFTVELLFPGGDIAKAEFIDANGGGFADGFVLDDLGFDVLAVCGNQLVESGEDCDDGNVEDGDGCSSTCQFEPPVPNPQLRCQRTIGRAGKVYLKDVLTARQDCLIRQFEGKLPLDTIDCRATPTGHERTDKRLTRADNRLSKDLNSACRDVVLEGLGFPGACADPDSPPFTHDDLFVCLRDINNEKATELVYTEFPLP